MLRTSHTSGKEKKSKPLTPRQVFKRSINTVTELWRKRRLSNFDYIMQLNKMSGRSFNDITQYPVFPWILTDYESETIDLNDSSVYRDLTMPVGALNPDRLAMLIERYNDLDGFSEEEKFLFGSHYSSPGVVLHYLIRQEPFTSMAVELQSGRFDCPDRLFFNMAQCWRGCMNSTSDVKELLPEFFTCPEIFLNTNNFPLGKMQDGTVISDVKLPPWAKGSAHEFVRINRAALESEYVTKNLHHWIDLIFGYKQRGPAAVMAHNVFHPLSYEGAVDMDNITDEIDRLATEAHIQNFGQTPAQLLLKDAHPPRYAQEDCWMSLCSNNRLHRFKELNSYRPPRQYGGKRTGHGAILSLFALPETVVAIHSDYTIASYRWTPRDQGIFPFTWKNDKMKNLCSKTLSRFYIPKAELMNSSIDNNNSFSKGGPNDDHSNGSFTFSFATGHTGNEQQQGHIPPSTYRFDGSTNQPCFGLVRLRENSNQYSSYAMNRSSGSAAWYASSSTLTKSMESRIDPASAKSKFYLLSSGYWDDAIKLHTLDTAKLTLRCNPNSGASFGESSMSSNSIITCMAVDECDNSIMVTGHGGRDATCRIWTVDDSNMSAALMDPYVSHFVEKKKKNILSLVHVLWGHSSPITCVALNSDLDVVVSGSVNGTLCLHTIRRGDFIRSMSFKSSVRRVVMETSCDCDGTFIVHLADGQLISCTINGVVLASINCSDNLICMEIQESVLITGGEAGVVCFRAIHDLSLKHTIDISYHGAVQSLCFTKPDALTFGQSYAATQATSALQYLFVGSDDGMISVIVDPKYRLELLTDQLDRVPP